MTNTVSGTVTDEELNAIIQIESAGNPNARASTSSASGLGQQLNATWLVLVKHYRPEWLKGRTQGQVLNLRFNPSYNIEMLARLAEESRAAIPGCTAGDLYLAHFLGVADAKKFFKANPAMAAAKLVDDEVVQANLSIFRKYQTAGAIRGWAAAKMAQPPHANWVEQFYTGDQPPPTKTADQPEADEVKPAKVEKPLPPFDPVPADADPVPPVEPAPQGKESFFGWLGKKWQAISSGLGLSGGIGGLAWFDWKVAAVVGTFGLIGGIAAYFIWRSQK